MGERFGQRLGVVALHVVVITGALLTVAPIAFMIYSSFKTTAEIFTLPPWLPPAEWSFKNYEDLLTKWPFPYWYINSLIYAGGGDGIRLVLLFARRFRFRQVSISRQEYFVHHSHRLDDDPIPADIDSAVCIDEPNRLGQSSRVDDRTLDGTGFWHLLDATIYSGGAIGINGVGAD